jgi:hypothetical protein
LDDSSETLPYYFQYYFATDGTSPLKINTMKPYTRRMLTNNYRLSHLQKSAQCAFGILNAKFKIFEGPICCKQETVNSVGKAYVILHNFIRIQKGLFCEDENYAVNQSSHHILNEDDDGRQRLSRA